MSDIWKTHPVARIQKLADKSIKNYQVENRNNFGYNELQDIQVENSDKSAGNTESGFDNDEEPYEEEHFAHIIDLDKVTERDRPPFFTVEEYYRITTTINKIT
ncbi:unnamed protein product [Rhizophagus irregularis]|nr:unnamed protein product [Rhizophagus irregularis]